MESISTYIGFNGKCREAMTFYQECLGGELDLQQVGGSPMEQMWPTGGKELIYHSTLTNGNMVIMGSDMSGPNHIAGNNMALAIGCSSEEEINNLFNKLGEGGIVLDPLGLKFWGAIFGTVQDKYGIRWMFNYYKEQQK
jgi:PhnB protein